MTVSPDRTLIFSPNWLGDAVMSLPALEALHAAHPEEELWVLTRRQNSGIYEYVPFLRGVIELPSGEPAGATRSARAPSGAVRIPRPAKASLPRRIAQSLWSYSATVKDLRQHRFQHAFLFPNSFRSALLVFLGGARRRVGYATDGRSALLTDAIPCMEEIRRLHMTAYYANVVESAGITMPQPLPAPQLRVTREQALRAKELLGRVRRPLWGLNPGAAYGGAKRWPADRFAGLAAELVSASGGSVVVFGGGSERDTARQVVSRLPAGRFVDLCGRTSLAELVAAIADCDVFITNDSGPMHVAQAVGTPLVAIFGPTDLATTGPSGGKFKIVRKEGSCPQSPCLRRACPTDHRCMTAIAVEEVARESLRMLGQRPESSRQ
ncbi:MAG: lipopolysaccharide heptosyltransferase II [Planctomycetota bacterium]|nr:lipopolysaccharide heptosyltransferase II [Planctomycetota bacterium]